jgi:hypothetical protein
MSSCCSTSTAVANVQPLLIKDPGPLTGRLLARRTRSFVLTVITNVDPHSMQVEEIRSAAGGRAPTVRPLGLQWPAGVSSLSHVSLPFPPDDPLYGYEPLGEDGSVRLGRVEAHGENGLLAIPPWVLMRQRSNPFHSYLTGASTSSSSARSALTIRRPVRRRIRLLLLRQPVRDPVLEDVADIIDRLAADVACGHDLDVVEPLVRVETLACRLAPQLLDARGSPRCTPQMRTRAG